MKPNTFIDLLVAKPTHIFHNFPGGNLKKKNETTT